MFKTQHGVPMAALSITQKLAEFFFHVIVAYNQHVVHMQANHKKVVHRCFGSTSFGRLDVVEIVNLAVDVAVLQLAVVGHVNMIFLGPQPRCGWVAVDR